MRVSDWLVYMTMGMRFFGIACSYVCMGVMFVENVAVSMFKVVVSMLVNMFLGKMEPNSCAHKRCRNKGK